MIDEQSGRPSLTTQQRLRAMSVPEKVRAALHGTREERTILVRDTNRLVAAAVVKSPKITLSEIDAISTLRNLDEEILRLIGTTPEWIQHYVVVVNLVRNPKTPLAISLKLLTRLSRRDITAVARDRNIAEALQKTAARMVEQRRR